MQVYGKKKTSVFFFSLRIPFQNQTTNQTRPLSWVDEDLIVQLEWARSLFLAAEKLRKRKVKSSAVSRPISKQPHLS